MNVLIIIDMQVASFENSDKYDSEGVINRINQLSQHTREGGGKVIFVLHDGVEEEGLLQNTPGWQLLPSLLKNDSDIVVRKTLNDAFSNTTLNQVLSELRADRVIICGWASDFCVDSTVRAATCLGHNVVVISDCHTVSNRPHLDAQQVIEHHNWVWQNLLTTNNTVQVMPLIKWCK